jgi:hypothetical protein
MDLSNYSLFGDTRNSSAIPANMLSANAEGEIDWGSVLAGGIRGAAQGAIRAQVNEKYADGQLVGPYNPPIQPRSNTTLLLVAVVAFLLLKS